MIRLGDMYSTSCIVYHRYVRYLSIIMGLGLMENKDWNAHGDFLDILDTFFVFPPQYSLCVILAN